MKRKQKIKVKKSIAVALSLILGISITIFATMLLLNVTDYGITIASFGATLFMVLSSKKLEKKKIYGSYALATVIGVIFGKVYGLQSLNVALAAVSAVIFMTVLNLQHPPAIGIAVSMVLNKFTIFTDIVVLLCLFFIISMTILLKLFLDDPNRAINFIEIEEEKIKWNLKRKYKPSKKKYINFAS